MSIFLAIAIPLDANAQTAPDGAMLRQQIEQNLPPLTPPSAAPVEKAALPPAMTPISESVTVREFRLVGNTLLTSTDLQAVLSDWLNRPVGFSQLQDATAAVAKMYRAAGWIVRVYLPRQEITDGVVTIQIVEARFGKVLIEAGELKRVRTQELQKWVQAQQIHGQPLNAHALDRSLLILSDLPGMKVAGSIKEGAQQGESDVVLKVAESALLTGDAAIDNTGSRSTGRERISVNLNLGSPMGIGDQGAANLSKTEGSEYLRLAYSAPLGYAGWRMGGNVSQMYYRVVAANITGESFAWGLDVRYPVYRAKTSNVYFNATLDRKTFDSLSDAPPTRERMDTIAVGLSGNRTDDFAGGGSNNASLTLSTGYVDLDGSTTQADDAITTRTAGHYTKLRWALSRVQTLNEQLSLFTNITGQRAQKNLYSGEKFFLGGASGVRAYPASEVGGSEGNMVNLELRWRALQQITLTGFYDWGNVRVNRNNDFEGRATTNRMSLAGAGLSVGWQGKSGVSTKLVWARRLGDNPNPTLTGMDQDGTLVRDRLWLSASSPF